MNGKFLKLTLKALRNEQWFNFFLEFKEFVQQYTPQALGIESQFEQFVVLLVKADIALEQIRKSALTSDIKSFDVLRDSSFRTLKAVWKLGLSEISREKREAAERVGIVFKHFGNLAAKPYNDATAGIINFIQEFRGSYAADAEILNLTPLVDKLESANSAFEAAILERNAEIADRPDINTVELRNETDRVYIEMLDRIEAQSLLNGNEVLDAFIRTLNANIERYKPHRRKKNDAEEEIMTQ